MKRVLLTGATGYLGGYIARELLARGYAVRMVARHPEKIDPDICEAGDVLKAEVTRPESLQNSCKNIDTVISTIGITRQKDGLTYMDVDYQANMNLLSEAGKSGVKKFIYVSVLNGERLKYLKICEAKEKFVKALERSGLNCCVIRPNGFFSDMRECYSMAQKGRIYLFGDGKQRSNPIHGEDLAKVCVDAVETENSEIRVGGPETLTQNEIAAIAFEASGNEKTITYIPDWIRRFILRAVRMVLPQKVYGPLEFFLTVMAMDMIAPEYGEHTLNRFFKGLAKLP